MTDGPSLELLSAMLAEQPDNPHVLFDLAQTCFELGLARDDRALLLNALEHYQHRADLEDGLAEEAYCAQHQVAVIAEQIGDWPLAIDAYMRAWELRPQRLESVQRLTTGLRERGLYHAAHRFARIASGLRPLQMPEDSLSLAPWVYEWGLLFEYSITSYSIGEYQNSIRASRALLPHGVSAGCPARRNATKPRARHSRGSQPQGAETGLTEEEDQRQGLQHQTSGR